ncbi:alpha-galactosidase A precursor [Aspergillus homomorphus CBS 101889]|uniref:Alpha-galactosidase A n=1 Tax=Aspergillus homomorphus (strain CBS 101889) TaxID=1450537 RepID=A0A395HQ41_ASPHC|nr:alpha-galactosidase A precursor [Aspergillus homomorphus CBS 101889]RAL09395.1 alpha-galactosidase A precursor [Aspergillus homomorphus CBS 101889]
MTKLPTVRLLECEVGENGDGVFRLLVDGQFVKYLTVEPGIYEVDDLCFEPSLVRILPKFPTGNWNEAFVARNDDDGQPYFACFNLTQFPSVQNAWHKTLVEYTDMTLGKYLRRGVYEAKCPGFHDLVVAKFATFNHEIQYLENETTAYQWLDGYVIGPQFLGHITEHGRVIGFLMERITDARHAGPEDLQACQEVLSRLHTLGLRHGDTNLHNFLIREGKAILIDFDTTRKCDDEESLRTELEMLPVCLADKSGRGGTTVSYSEGE